MRVARLLALLLMAGALFAAGRQTQPAAQSPFQFQEAMVPVRDGVRLQTVILTPTSISKPLPILLRRTPPCALC